MRLAETITLAMATADPLARQHREFAELALAARAWDQTFEAAIGTYPTEQFVTGYRSFSERLDRIAAWAWNSELGSPLFDVGYQLRIGRPNALPTLENMARTKATFQPFAGTGSQLPWPSLLDGVVAQLRRGERILAAQLQARQPYLPPAPNPGVPGVPGQDPFQPAPTPIP
jgi:hypothetical protein